MPTRPRVPDLALTTAQIRYDLKIGRAWLAIFDTPEGEAVMEYRAPQGMRGEDAFLAGCHRLVLWLSGAPARVLADVDLTEVDRAMVERGLGALLARGSEVAGDEKALFDLLLRLVRDHHLGNRKGVVKVGDSVASTGVPTLEAWAACDGLSIRVEALDAALSTYIENEVLTPENVRTLVADSLVALADQPDSLTAERETLQDEITDLDRRIRLTGAQVSAGILDIDDAKAVNAPLMARRESARLRLSAMPSRQPLPKPEAIDPELFRAAVLQAWQARPLEERREALDKLVEKITLQEGGAQVEYLCKSRNTPLRHHEPPGPPNTPISPRLPSASRYSSPGSPASLQGEPPRRVKSPAAASVNKGSAERFPSPLNPSS